MNEQPNAVRGLRGPKADIQAKLDTDYALTPELAAYLKAKVDASPHAGLTVHAHEHHQDGDWHVSVSITKLFALMALCSLCLGGQSFGAIVSSNMVTYAATGGASTNTGNPVLIGTAYISSVPNFVVSDGGTTATNALTVYVQYGLDTNYYATVATYTKGSTNAAQGVINPGNITLRIYAQTKVVTTNNVTVGTQAILQQ